VLDAASPTATGDLQNVFDALFSAKSNEIAPLLDAIGAGKAVLASSVGSISEVAGKAAWYVDADAGVDELHDALQALAMPELREPRASAAAERARELSWESAALMHRELFERALAPARPSPAGVAVTS